MSATSSKHAPGASAACPPAWWRHGNALARFAADLLAAEFAAARPGRPATPIVPDDGLDLAHDLGADSLDLQQLATALVEALQLHAGGGADRLLASSRLDDWLASARASLDASGGTALTFRTSGSAGAPKRCSHALATLWQECDELAQLLPGRQRILSAVPSHHIYGFLFTVLLPLRVGDIEVLDLRAAAPAALLDLARPGDLVVAYPLWWADVLRPQAGFAPDVAGVTSTAPCADPLAAALADAGLRLLQMYGSSETAGVGWRSAAAAPFTLLPYWTRGLAPDTLVRSPSCTSYPVQDRLMWRDARHFHPDGRIDAAVQVGGVNVFPAYVADVLRMHPRVADAAVRLMRADEGARLKAFVVPRAAADGVDAEAFDADALAQALSAFAAERLGTPERPAAYTFGPRLPRQASGKPADWIIDA